MKLFAYLDAGSVSMMLTAILGGLAGIVATIKMYGKRAFGKLLFWRKDEPEETTGPSTAPSDTAEHKAAK